MKAKLIYTVLVVIAGLLCIEDVIASNFGHFQGVINITKEGVKNCPKSDYGSEDANFIVKSKITYIDPKGEKWSVPVGACVNGASIPRAFWTIAGAPWTGKYIKSAMVHDHQCTIRKRSSSAVHRAFYYSMRAEGVSGAKARAMYYSVLAFGPRWRSISGVRPIKKCDENGCKVINEPYRESILVKITPPKIDFQKLETDPSIQNTSLQELEKKAHRAFAEAYKKQR